MAAMAWTSCAQRWMTLAAAAAAMTLGATTLADGPVAPNRPFALPGDAKPAPAEIAPSTPAEVQGPTFDTPTARPDAKPESKPESKAPSSKPEPLPELVRALEPAQPGEAVRDPIAETIKAQDERAKIRSAKVKSRESMPLGATSQRPVESSPAKDAGKDDAKIESPNTTSAGTTAGFDTSWVRTAVALAGVVALALVVAWVFKSAARANGGLMSKLGAGGRAPSGVVEVLARYPVGKGQTLVLFKIDRRVLVVSQNVGKNGPSMSVLTEVTDAESVASLIAKTSVGLQESSVEKFRRTLHKADRDSREVLAAAAPAPAAIKPARPAVQVNRPAVIATLGARPGKSKEDAVAELRRKLTAIRSGTGMGVSA